MELLPWLVKAAGVKTGSATRLEVLHRDSGLDYCTDGFRLHVAPTNAESVGVLGIVPQTAPVNAVWVNAGELYTAARLAIAAGGKGDLYLVLPDIWICVAAVYVADAASGTDKDDVCQIMAWAPERPLVINDPEHFALMMPKTMLNADPRLQPMIAEGHILAVCYVNNYPMLAGRLEIQERHPVSGFVPGWPHDARGECVPPLSDGPETAAKGKTVSLPDDSTVTVTNTETGEHVTVSGEAFSRAARGA
jgi:hypothetical protein